MLKKLTIFLCMFIFLASCTVIHYDYTAPRMYRQTYQHSWLCGQSFWSPWFWYGMYNWTYQYSYWYGNYDGRYYRGQNKLTGAQHYKLTKRQLKAPGNGKYKALRSRVTKGTVSRTQVVRPTATNKTKAVSGRQGVKKSTNQRVKK